MNPLARALKLAEDPRTGPAAHTAGGTPDPTIPESGRFGPIRATRDGPSSETLSRAALALGDAPEPEATEGVRLAPIRATGATRVAEVADANPDVPGDDLAAPQPTAASRTASAGAAAGAPSDSTSAAPGDAQAMRAVIRADFRSLRRGRGIGRLVGVALSLLAVAGTALGGIWLWKTEFAHPSLVRHLTALPVADLAPVHAANAAVDRNPEPAAGATLRTEDPVVRLPAAQTTQRHAGGAGPRSRPSEAPRSDGPPNSSAAAPNREPHPLVSTDAALPPLHVAVMDPTSVHAANAVVGEAPAPAAGVATRKEALPVGSQATHGEGSHPAASTAAPPAPERDTSATGLPAPGAPADLGRIATAEGAAPGGKRDDVDRRARSDARVVIRKRVRTDHVAASLERAYAAYLAGDVETAGQAYRTVLGQEPRNRDARLGLAAVAARAGRWAEAADHYATLLASHPADTAARAALIAIGEKDPARAESRLKALLRIEPEAAHLHFNLGNLYASQSRWPEAQQSWFSAYRLDRGNADHAYNLAVSLEHMSQARNALDLYREALVLAHSSPASFEAEAVRARIRALESRPDAERPPDGSPPEAAAAGAAHAR